MNPNDRWLLSLIARGLQKLTLLSLDRTPAMDAIEGTALTWLEAITTDRVWDEARDTARIRRAFATLERERTMWPAPRHLLDALPRIEAAPMLTNRVTHTDSHRRRVLEQLQVETAGLFRPEEVKPKRDPDEALDEAQIRQREFRMGAQAAMNGRTQDACPHRANDPATGRKAAAWLDGFYSVGGAA